MNSNDNIFPKLEFDKNRTRVKLCPCGKDNRDGKFSPYIGYDDKGHCFGCGETFLPVLSKKEFTPSAFKKSAPRFVQEAKPVSFIPLELLKQSLKAYDHNNFVSFLSKLVGIPTTNIAVGKYLIGTSRYWPNSTIFWQVAKDGVRSGKIIQYQIIPSESSFIGKDCKRNKNNVPAVRWVHNDSRFKDFNLNQALFGQHLLDTDITKTIAIVESEKTAVIASAYLPTLLWLAAGSLTNLSLKRCQVLKGRTVVLFPDLNGFELWSRKAEELSSIATVTVSDLLERKASSIDRKSGLDLADYLTRFDYEKFVAPEPTAAKQLPHPPQVLLTEPAKEASSTIPHATIVPIKISTELPPIKDSGPLRRTYRIFNFEDRCWGKCEIGSSWDTELEELKAYFESIDLPAGPLKLDSGSTIIDIQRFVLTHLETLKHYDGNKNFKPFLERLRFLKEMLRKQNKIIVLKPP